MSPFFKINDLASHVKSSHQINVVLALRSVAIVIQFLLILFVNIVLDYQLPWTPLLSVIAVELSFTFLSFLIYRSRETMTQTDLLIQICADIVFLSILLFFSGGATNAFVSLLLIPIAIAAVTLTPTLITLVSLLAISSYSLLLWLLPMSVMHGNMQGHFIAMGINFLFSSLVVAIVVGRMARTINQRELAIAAYRENLLKQEQVTALGVASAQVTHQIATPITTIQLLADELAEEQPNNNIIHDMQGQLKRCRESLNSFREMVFAVKEQNSSLQSIDTLLTEIMDNIQVNYPDIAVILDQDTSLSNCNILADAALLPAILNLINNAIRATRANQHDKINLTSRRVADQWQFIIRDYGLGFTVDKLKQLGVKPVTSEHGLGMAVFLSYASLERLGGKLVLTNHLQGGALVTLSLPIHGEG